MVIIIAGIVSIGIAVLFLQQDQDSTYDSPPIKISINAWPGYAHVFVAQEKGFFEKNNVPVELIFNTEYQDSVNGFLSGETDGAFMVFSDTIFYNDNTLDLKVVYFIDHSDTGDVIIGSTNSITDLKGKTVGIESVNSFSHIFVLKSLEKFGLDETNVYFKVVSAHNVLQALEEGVIDAGHTWDPTKSRAIKKGYNILYTAGQIPGIITDVLVFNSKIVQERPEDVRSIIKAMIEAQEYRDTNLEESIAIMANAENMTLEEMRDGLQSITSLNLQDNVRLITSPDDANTIYNYAEFFTDFYLKRGQINNYPNFEEIIKDEFINSFQNDLTVIQEK